MSDLDYLERQETLVAMRLQRALLGGDGSEDPLAAIEQAATRNPWLSVGTAVALGGVLGATLASPTCRRLLAGPVLGLVRRRLF